MYKRQILCQSILYIEKLGRKAFIHTNDARVYQCNITLEKIWEQLNPSKFAAIHISCIVNLTEIASIKCDQLKLKNNEVLYVCLLYTSIVQPIIGTPPQFIFSFCYFTCSFKYFSMVTK